MIQNVNLVVNPERKEGIDVQLFSEYVPNRQEALVKHTIREQNDDPFRQCTFEPDSALPVAIGRRRVGRPRDRWAYSTLQRMSNKYDAIQKQYFKDNLSAVCSSLGSRVQARTI